MSKNANLADCVTATHYFAQRLLFREAAAFAKEGFGRFDNEYLGFWWAYCLFRSGKRGDAQIALADVERNGEVFELVQKLKGLMAGQPAKTDYSYRPGTSEAVAFNMVLFYWAEGDDKAAKSVLKGLPPGIQQFELLKGMAVLRTLDTRRKSESSTNLSSAVEKARGYLLTALQMRPDHGLTLLALISLEEKARQTKEMGTYVTKLSETLRVDVIVALEKTNYFVACGNWDSAATQLDAASSADPTSILVLKMRLLEVFSRLNQPVSPFEVFSRLTSRIEQDYGSDNLELLLDVVGFVNRVAGNSEVLLSHSASVLSKIRSQAGDDYGLLTELGLAHFLLGEIEEAEGCYQRAASLESSQVEHILRLVHIKLFKNELDEADGNLEFFKEISSTLNYTSAEVGFLEALLHFLRGKRALTQGKTTQAETDFAKSERLFGEALRAHVQASRGVATGFGFFRDFNPSFLLGLASFFMKDMDLCLPFAKLGLRQTNVPPAFFATAVRLLEVLVEKMPGIQTAHLMLAKAHILNNSLEAAQTILDRLLEGDGVPQAAHVFALFVALLKAQETKSDEEVQRVVSQSTSANFELLQNPEYLFLKSQAEVLAGNHPAALKTLQKAKQVAEGTKPDPNCDSPHRRGPRPDPRASNPKLQQLIAKRGDSDKSPRCRPALKAQIDCELAVLSSQNGEKEAGKTLIQEAICQFAGSNCSIFVILANSEIAIANKDLKTAIDILKNVDASDQGFVISRKKLADIYLRNLKQNRPFIQSLSEVASKFPTPENKRVLADGHFAIAEFEEAQTIYSELCAKEPENEELCLRVGECFVRTHNFVKARTYFAGLIRSAPDCLSYKVFMCELLRKIRMLGEVPTFLNYEEVVAKIDRPENKPTSKRQFETKTRAAVLLAEYYAWIHKHSEEEGHFKRAVGCMEAAIDTQRQLIDWLRASYKRVDAEKKTLADLDYQLMVLLSTRCTDLNTVLPSIEDAIKNDPENLTYHLINGRLHLSMGNIDLAKEKAKQIFKTDFRHPEAILLFADCLLRSNQVDSGLKGFQKIFEKDLAANNSTFTLTALVWFHRAAGTLPEFLKLLARHSRALPDAPADRSKPRGHPTGGNDPFLSYCYGVYYYSIRNFNAAIEEFAKCRNTPILAGPVAVMLTDIYLHSNAFNLYSNFLQKEKFRTIPKQHLEIAQKIVEEISDPDYKVEKEVLGLAILSFLDPTRLPDAIKGLEVLLARPSAESSQSMILYYLAVLHLRSKEKDRLKDIFHAMKELPFRPKRCFDEYYFRASMLCADTFLFKDKAKAARSLVDQCVATCKGCLLPYDYLIVHNERAKESCVDILRTAFQITNNEDPNLGYKLAKDLMAENRPHESFQVCKTVLAKYPKFRQIETEVLLRVKEDLLSNC